MKRKIFFRFFSVTLISIILMFVCGIIAVNVNADALMKERLKEETELVCSFVKTEDDFQNFAAYENDDAFRVTVMDLSGNVLYESDTKSPLENHGEREEFKNAVKGSPTAVKRYSETFGCDMTYYAARTTLSGGEEVVIRLAVKSSQINEYISVALPILIAVLAVSLAASLIVSGYFSKTVSNKISEIGVSLASLNEGDYKPIKTDTSEPELFSVLSSINAVNESAREHIRSISDEHNKLNTVLKNVSQGIIAVDGGGNVVFANKSVFSIFDSAVDVIGKNIVYLIDDVSLCEKITAVLNENHQIEHSYKNKELSVAIRTVEGGDSTVSSIVIITDVTKEKTLQNQKNDFFANASHELKTPVTVMQGLSEILLAKDGLDEVSKKQVKRINSESIRLASLISDMLKLSKLENGELDNLSLVDVDLRKIANEVVLELNEELEKRNVTADINGTAVIKADNAKIFEVLQNLLSNAVHYNKDGGKIEVNIIDGDDKVTLQVTDTGIGIEKENIPRLCERFYRVDKSRSKKTGGTGLGLAIVKHVCALYKADLSIDSEIGVGTTVTIEFYK